MIPHHNPHPCLDCLVEEVQRLGSHKLAIVFAWRFAEVIPQRFVFLRRITEFVELAFRIWANRNYDFILVREFSTYYFYITFALIFPVRHKCILLNSHNIQSATQKPIEKFLLELLSRLGVRFACLESSEGARLILGNADTVMLPHPVRVFPELPESKKFLRRSSTIVGMVGDLRPEKGFDLVIPYLIESLYGHNSIEFRLGSNRAAEAKCKYPSLVVSDTSSQDDYISFLLSLDILILPYNADAYTYRVSGVIAEAIGCGTAVICTDLPCLSRQVLFPVSAGAVLKPSDFLTPLITETIYALAADSENLREAIFENAIFREPRKAIEIMLSQLYA
jgi:glycosyltransferase involved in cell wall biosynthesis